MVCEGVYTLIACSWVRKTHFAACYLTSQEGDAIKTFDRLCEVQSDKATVEITSRYEGIVAKVYSKEGDIVKVIHRILCTRNATHLFLPINLAPEMLGR